MVANGIIIWVNHRPQPAPHSVSEYWFSIEQIGKTLPRIELVAAGDWAVAVHLLVSRPAQLLSTWLLTLENFLPADLPVNPGRGPGAPVSSELGRVSFYIDEDHSWTSPDQSGLTSFSPPASHCHQPLSLYSHSKHISPRVLSQDLLLPIYQDSVRSRRGRAAIVPPVFD